MSKSSIEWTGHTWNPLSGCTPKSSGCLRCYAAVMSNRLGAMGQEKYKGLTVLQNGNRVFNGVIHLDEAALEIPLRRKKPTTYFVNSMSDLFWGDEDDLKTAKRLGTADPKPVPFEFIDKVFAVMPLCPRHTFQVLTKRPERMAAYLPGASNRIYRQITRWLDEGDKGFLKGSAWTHAHDLAGQSVTGEIIDIMGWRMPLKNCWLGTSCENQQTADERIPHLLGCPGAVRFLSCEPLLAAIDLTRFGFCGGASPRPVTRRVGGKWDGYLIDHENGCDWHPGDMSFRSMSGINWVIVGGESGPGARPMNPQWVRDLRDQCAASSVAFFFKQWGEYGPMPEAMLQINSNFHRDDPYRFGKKAAGRLLDGRTWDEFPK